MRSKIIRFILKTVLGWSPLTLPLRLLATDLEQDLVLYFSSYRYKYTLASAYFLSTPHAQYLHHAFANALHIRQAHLRK